MRDKEALKYLILEKSHYIYLWDSREIAARKKSSWVLIVFSIAIIIIGILSATGYIQIISNKPLYFDGSLIGGSFSVLLVNVWVVTIKRRKSDTLDLENLNNQDLESYLEAVLKSEKDSKRMGAGNLSFSIFVIMVCIFIGIYQTDMFGAEPGVLTKGGELLIALVLFNIAISQISIIIFSPLLRSKSKTASDVLNNKIASIFLTHLDDSQLNPLKNK